MTVVGTRDTSSGNQTLRRYDWNKEIDRYDPNDAPFVTLLNNMTKKSTRSYRYQWVEKDTAAYMDQINYASGYTAGETVLKVDTPTMFGEHDIVKNTSTGEYMRVVSVDPGASTIQVKRGLQGSVINIADDNKLVILGGAQPQGDVAKTPRSENPVELYNHTQIFRDPFSQTNTAAGEEREVVETEWDEIKVDKAIEHQRNKGLTYYHGVRTIDTTGTHPRTTTQGLIDRITTNKTDMGGTMTETELFAFLRPLFRYGKTKLLLCAPLVVDVINAFPKGKLELVQADHDKSYGVDILELITPFGKAKIVNDWLLEQSDTQGRMFALDTRYVKERFKTGGPDGNRDSKLIMNNEDPSEDARAGEFLSEVGLEVKLEKTHGQAYNITG